jgi:HSP20 family molecular chaperone IbpA
MAFDSIDKIFNDVLKRYSKLLGHDMSGNFPAFPSMDTDEEAGEFEQENDSQGSDEKHEPRAVSRKFGYEIISGSDMKEPIIRIYGNPDEFPELKGRLEGFLKHNLGSFLDKQEVPTQDALPIDLEVPAINTGQTPMKEPFSESFKEKDGSTTVNVDLPGIKDADVTVTIDGKTLRVEARGENRHYQKDIPLEHDITSKQLAWRMNNGVLEIKIQAAA